ncbi:GDSL-type esterase/lipase family protein [Streptomyces sp. NPDC102406]|uniref:GDSL-type esterase/lipase family protein n=1 Tax=Streptomyces sp. NPDC102406 TaxID=3366171 RepID=UPI003821703B
MDLDVPYETDVPKPWEGAPPKADLLSLVRTVAVEYAPPGRVAESGLPPPDARRRPVREYVRGASWWAPDGRPVRADPADRDRLPADTWERALVPAGVRLEFTAHGVTAVEVAYEGSEPSEVDARRGIPAAFTVVGGVDVPAAVGTHVARLPLPRPDGTYTVQLPAALRPLVQEVRALGGGAIEPSAPRPRWLVYGDSLAEGWAATRPHFAWPSVAGRALGVEDVNLGYAGAARGELASAQQLASLEADLVAVAFGTHCWTRTPHTAPLLYETARAFLAVVRAGHPHAPLLVLSPVLRPDAETTPNALGATLAELRHAVERAARDAVDSGDERLVLLPGGPLLGAEHLVDGVHPGDRGHLLLARAVAESLRKHRGPGNTIR